MKPQSSTSEGQRRPGTKEAIGESEYKLRQIIDTVPGLIWSTGPDGSEGKKAEEQPRFVKQLQGILNVLPAYTCYATPSGPLIFLTKRTPVYLGLPPYD